MSAPNKLVRPRRGDPAAPGRGGRGPRRGARRDRRRRRPRRAQGGRGSPTPATGRRSPWPTARSARCRRRPRPRPGSGWARRAQQVRAALEARQAELEAERDARVLVEEAVDVTLPYDRWPRRRAAPADDARRPDRRRLRRDGLRGRRGPRGRGRVVQLRRAQLPRPTTRRAACRTRSSSSRRTAASCCARTPPRCRRARC